MHNMFRGAPFAAGTDLSEETDGRRKENKKEKKKKKKRDGLKVGARAWALEVEWEDLLFLVFYFFREKRTFFYFFREERKEEKKIFLFPLWCLFSPHPHTFFFFFFLFFFLFLFVFPFFFLARLVLDENTGPTCDRKGQAF